jgi:CSLREA domain-containing protein
MEMRWGRAWLATAVALVTATLAVGGSVRTATSATACNLVPQLRDVTINQGVGSFTPLEFGKETLVRLYLSMPSCAASGASIQVTGATLSVSGASQSAPVPMAPTPSPTAYPTIATFGTAPMPSSTGDPTFVVPGPALAPAGGAAFTATFSATVNFQSKASKSATPVAGTPVTFTKLPTSLTNPAPSATNITAAFDKKTNPFHVLVVPMGDASKVYSTQFTSAAQAAIQDGMTGTVSRIFPLAAGVGNLGSTGGEGLQYTITPTLLPLNTLFDSSGAPLLDSTGKFCGTGASYAAIKGQLFQMLRTWQTGNPGIQVDSVLGAIDPLIARGPPDPCFQGMGSLGSAEAWTQAITGQGGQLAGLELAHTLGLVPKDREDPFDAAHSQNITAENPQLNRRFNVVQRAFIPTDRSLMKPSAPSPVPDNVNTLFEAPDFAYARAVFGGTTNPEFTQFPKTLGGITAATLAFVMSGTTDGTATGTNVVESYFSSQTQLTQPDSTSGYFLRQLPTNTVTGVPVGFANSEHGGNGTSQNGPAGLFSIAQATNPNTTRIEFWKGQPGASGSLLLYARNQSDAPVITSMSAGSPIVFRAAKPPADAAPPNAPPPPSALNPTRSHGRHSARLRATKVQVHRVHEVPAHAVLSPTTWPAPFLTWTGLDPIFTVNSTGDGADATPGDGTCDDGSGNCTLRAAIQEANAIPGGDQIKFEIGTGPQTITPASPLPGITDPVQIDGTTQPGYTGKPLIELSGAAAGTGTTAIGLDARVDNITIQGLVINRFAYVGIELLGKGDVVANDYIGTTASGAGAAGNQLGIFAQGGPNSITGNVISGNVDGIYEDGTGDQIQNNLIGTNAAGTGAVGNTADGIFSDHGTQALIGGTAATERNVISGNGTRGIRLQGDQNVVEGNYIGVAADGTAALGNGTVGVQVGIKAFDGTIFGSNNRIGGTATGAGNLIAYNGGPGVNVSDSTGNAIEGNSITGNSTLGIGLDGGTSVLPNDTGDPDTGANNRQNFPVISSVVNGTITGTLNSETSKTYRVEFFSNSACDSSGYGEGARFLGSTDATTDGSGDASFSASPPLVATGEYVTATATDPSGNTSEFSACVQATGGTGDDAPQSGPTFTVNTADDHDDGLCSVGDCSLREAINAANTNPGTDQIVFGISGSAPHTISVTSALPAITQAVTIDGADANIVDGANAGATANGLVFDTGSGSSTVTNLQIRNFDNYEIDLKSSGNTIGNDVTDGNVLLGHGGVLVESGADENVIAGNSIGFDPGPATVNAGAGSGVRVDGASGTVIGDDVSPPGNANLSKGNVIVGFGDGGVYLNGSAAAKITGNRIGTNLQGATGMGNNVGVIVTGVGANTIGPANEIARNTGIGVDVGSAGNRIVANSIHDNGGVGIRADVATAAPTLTSAIKSGTTTTVNGTFSGAANRQFFIEFFNNGACDPSGSGEGQTYILFTTATTNGSGDASFSFATTAPALGDVITATATDTVTAETGDFSNCMTVAPGGPPPAPGQEAVTVAATDDHPQDMRVDLFLDCGPGKPKLPIAVALKPDSAAGTSASFSYNYDPSLACPNGTLKAIGNDGFTSTGFTTLGSAPVDPGPDKPRVAITNPVSGAQFLTYSLIPLRGSARDSTGELPDGGLTWSLTGPSGLTRSGTGHQVDLNPPTNGGWPSGTYTLTLTGANSTQSTTTTTTFTVATDADNDGIPASVESQSCFTTGDNDPLNAYSDYDGDGIPNASDPQPCTPATSYTATADFNPDPLPYSSTGNTVTVNITIPGRNVAQVIGSSVRITNIAGADVSSSNDPAFKNIAWTISSGVGIAKFDRQKLLAYLSGRGIHNRRITITVAGRSGAPPWTFQGSDSTFVQG